MSLPEATDSLSGKLIILVRTSSKARVPVYESLHRAGVGIIMVHPFLLKDIQTFIRHWIITETFDIPRLISRVSSFLSDMSIFPDACFSFDEYGVYPAACLAESLGLRPIPLPSKCIRSLMVKSEFRMWCEKHNLPTPKYVIIESPELIEPVISSSALEYPIVVKSSPGAGSILVKLCSNSQEAISFAKYAFESFQSLYGEAYQCFNLPMHLLLEEYIGGAGVQEVDIDAIIHNGNCMFFAVSDNLETLPPFFCERGGQCPSSLSDSAIKNLKSVFLKFISKFDKQMTGVLHFEAKYDTAKDKVYIIEVNCRMGSAEVFSFIEKVYSINLSTQFLKYLFNLPLDPIPVDYPKFYCASVNLYPDKEGICNKIECSSLDDPTLVSHLETLSVGDFAKLPPNGFSLVAFAVSYGKTPQEARENVTRIASAYTITID